MSPFWRVPVLSVAVVTFSMAALAQPNNAQKSLGAFSSWHAYSYNEKAGPVCYMTKTIHFSVSKKFKRGSTYLMITHRPGEGSKDVVSYISGYVFKPTSDVKVTIDKKTFSMFTQKDTAWSRDPATDRAIAAAIRTGKNMKVSGIPAAKGTHIVSDTIDLKGAPSAYASISKACFAIRLDKQPGKDHQENRT